MINEDFYLHAVIVSEVASHIVSSILPLINFDTNDLRPPCYIPPLTLFMHEYIISRL